MTDHLEQNGQTKINVAKLEVRVDELSKNVTRLTENHIPHIYDRLGGIEKKIAYWSGGAALAGIIIQAVVASLK